MKIVILDGYTANPGDLDWDLIDSLGSLTVIDRTINVPKKILEAIGNADAVLTNKTILSKEVLDQAPNLKYIGVMATGYNVVAIEAAKALGITVTNVPSYSTQSVAQLVFALLLEFCHHVGDHNLDVKKGGWTRSKDFSYWKNPLIELSDKTMGIIGFGNIGQATAQLAKAFGMKVLFYTRSSKPELEDDVCKQVSLEVLLAQSDVISLHTPLTDQTEHLIRKDTLSQMKESAILINTSRGLLIHEQDLANALNYNQLYGAAIDVASVEPIYESNPLLEAKNCIITPHIAWATKEARTRLIAIAGDNLIAYISGKPVNVVG